MAEYGGKERRGGDDRREGWSLRRTASSVAKGVVFLKWPLLALAVLLGILLLAGKLDGLMPWSNKGDLKAAQDSLVVLEAERDSLNALAAVRGSQRDAEQVTADSAKRESEQHRIRAARLASTNKTQREVITDLRDAEPATEPTERIVQLEIIVVEQGVLIDSLTVENVALIEAFNAQLVATVTLQGSVDSLNVELADMTTDRDRYRTNAKNFDAASGCGFPGILIGCPSSTTVALLTAVIVVPLTLLVERNLTDHSNPPAVVVFND